MVESAEELLRTRLEARRLEGSLRALPKLRTLSDFSSNDYLGLSRSQKLKALLESELERCGFWPLGAGGSRLISGNSDYLEALEAQIAEFHGAHSALVFNSGYSANLGLIGAIGERGTNVVYDEYSHASIRDGIRASFAKGLSFVHNDLKDLEKKLKLVKSKAFVVVEALYSMDGDMAPLPALVDLCEFYKAGLIVDEAHSSGIFGPEGRGLVCDAQLEDRIFARVHTFGKALGSHGAAVLGSTLLKEYLVNFARSLIYTTALPFHNLASIKTVYEFLPQCGVERQRLQMNIRKFEEYYPTKEGSPIKPIAASGNERARAAANFLQESGLDVRAILSPTVPKTEERLRVVLHSFNSESDIAKLALALKEVL